MISSIKGSDINREKINRPVKCDPNTHTATTYMMSVIVSFWILCGSPRDTATLGRNHDNFTSLFFDEIGIQKGRRDPQEPNGANL